jgi:hypothetical protein
MVKSKCRMKMRCNVERNIRVMSVVKYNSDYNKNWKALENNNVKSM